MQSILMFARFTKWHVLFDGETQQRKTFPIPLTIHRPLLISQIPKPIEMFLRDNLETYPRDLN